MIRLNVVTPERAFLDVQALAVTLPGKLGEAQVLEGHAPCLMELKAGLIIYEDSAHKTTRFMVGQGFAEINSHEINVLCEIAKYREEVDREHELALQRDLDEKLKTLSELELDEQKKLSIELERSVASINLLE